MIERTVYIAGASAEIERAERAIAYARSVGLAVSYDWTVDVRKAMAAGVRDSELEDVQARYFALNDLEGVAFGRAFVFLAPPREINSTGCWIELGYALNPSPTPRFIVVSRERAPRRSIFESLATVPQCPADDAAILLVAQHLLGDDGQPKPTGRCRACGMWPAPGHACMCAPGEAP